MRSTHTISFLLMGAFLITPLASFAEVADNKAAGVPMLYEAGPDKERPVMTRTMASGTRPIPAAMEKRIEAREAQPPRPTCTREDGTIASGTDCMTVRAEQRTEVRERIQARRAEILHSLTTLMVKRLNAAIERELKLADRIDSRIAKLKENQIVTTEAEAKILLARTKISEAKVAVAAAEAKIAEIVAAANTSAVAAAEADFGKPVRDEMNKAKEAIFAAHKALVDAVVSLKANIKAVTATETPSSTEEQTAQ